MVATDLARDTARKSWFGWLMQPVMQLTWKHPTEGGSEIVYAATQQGVSGKYFGEHHEVAPSKHAEDALLARAMWKVTENVVHRLLTHEEHVAELAEEKD
jgi:hypothetical protein